MRLAVRREQPVDERLQAVGLLDDDLRVLGQRARLDFHLQQLRCAADAAERVFDFMREVADQLLVGLRLIERALLAILPRLLLDLDELDDHVVRVVHLIDDHMHRQGVAMTRRRAPQLGFEPARRKNVVQHRGHRVVQQLRVDEPVEQRSAQHAAARHAEHVLERGVGKHAASVGVDDRDHRRQIIERGVRGRRRPRAARGDRVVRWNELHCGSLDSSRLIAAMSFSLRAMLAFMSATRSRYF